MHIQFRQRFIYLRSIQRGNHLWEDTDDTTYTALLETTDKAVSKTDAVNATTSELEEGDAAGPFAVAVAMEKTIDEDTVAKVVVAGSVEMFADSADQIVSGNNSAMFTDIIAQMVGDSDLATSVIAQKITRSAPSRWMQRQGSCMGLV